LPDVGQVGPPLLEPLLELPPELLELLLEPSLELPPSSLPPVLPPSLPLSEPLLAVDP
jgi:hypothetical protein